MIASREDGDIFTGYIIWSFILFYLGITFSFKWFQSACPALAPRVLR